MPEVVCAGCGEKSSELNVCCAGCGAALPASASGPTGSSADETLPPSRTARPISAPDARIGATVEQYTITGSLGRGGMGVVYRAMDTKLGRHVALKFLSPALVGDAQAKARFVREARALSALDHPNVGSIYELGDHGGQPFLALALYEGETLKERIARGPLPIPDALRVVRETAAGLAAAHAAGIVHRDVKPANVMITHAGPTKLLDFGIAKLLNATGGSVLTQAGAVLGTLAYAAPEQIVGEPLDHRSDLWSLGIIAYETVTGVVPFHAKRRSEVASRIFTDEPTPPSAMRPDVPEVLTRVIHGLLRKAPDARIQRATDVVEMLAGE